MTGLRVLALDLKPKYSPPQLNVRLQLSFRPVPPRKCSSCTSGAQPSASHQLTPSALQRYRICDAPCRANHGCWLQTTAIQRATRVEFFVLTSRQQLILADIFPILQDGLVSIAGFHDIVNYVQKHYQVSGIEHTISDALKADCTAWVHLSDSLHTELKTLQVLDSSTIERSAAPRPVPLHLVRELLPQHPTCIQRYLAMARQLAYPTCSKISCPHSNPAPRTQCPRY